MKKVVIDIILRREHLGFLLGVACLLAAQELSDPWNALIVLAAVFVIWPLIRKYGK